MIKLLQREGLCKCHKIVVKIRLIFENLFLFNNKYIITITQVVCVISLIVKLATHRKQTHSFTSNIKKKQKWDGGTHHNTLSYFDSYPPLRYPPLYNI
jgi:hypothetical protein